MILFFGVRTARFGLGCDRSGMPFLVRAASLTELVPKSDHGAFIFHSFLSKRRVHAARLAPQKSVATAHFVMQGVYLQAGRDLVIQKFGSKFWKKICSAGHLPDEFESQKVRFVNLAVPFLPLISYISVI